MQMEGEWESRLAPADAWAKLTDAAFLASCLEGVDVVRTEHDVAVWRMRPALGFMTGSIETTLTIHDLTPMTSMNATVFSKGIGASTTVETHLTFSPKEQGTCVHWTAHVTQLTGLLKMTPRGLVEGAANKVVSDVWTQIGNKLSVDSPPQ
jgi:carbon monoxide dehydrogenase subunit G